MNGSRPGIKKPGKQRPQSEAQRVGPDGLPRLGTERLDADRRQHGHGAHGNAHVNQLAAIADIAH